MVLDLRLVKIGCRETINFFISTAYTLKNIPQFTVKIPHCLYATYNRKKYKAYILKYKALILKYVLYVFYKVACVFFTTRNRILYTATHETKLPLIFTYIKIGKSYFPSTFSPTRCIKIKNLGKNTIHKSFATYLRHTGESATFCALPFNDAF